MPKSAKAYPCHHLWRLRRTGRLDHRLGIVGADDHPVGLFRQQRPEAPGTARQVQYQARLASQRQGATGQLLVSLVGQPSRQAVLVLEEVLTRMVPSYFSENSSLMGLRIGHLLTPLRPP
jgi:hypothetical protein